LGWLNLIILFAGGFMYTFILAVHNILRWIVLILAVLALVRAYSGWFGRREWTDTDRKVGSFFGVSLDVQLLLGLILYFALSPITRGAFQDFGAAMANDAARFFALEHVLYMVLAVVFAHVGSVFSRRATEDVNKHRRAAIWFTLAVLVILIGIPWFRPLLPAFG
jgi:uncharacterized membrane protein YozB (DUF420 family)